VEYLIVMIEGVIVVAVTSLAWGLRRSRPSLFFLCGILLGMAWCAFLHGFCFGVLDVEGRHSEQDPRGLAGFGLVAALFFGIPLGTGIGLVLGAASRLRERRRAIRLRRLIEEWPG
jgi:hypothetical protein